MPLHRSPYARVLLLTAILVSVLVVPTMSTAAQETRVAETGPRSYLPFADQPVSLVATDVAVPPNGSLDYTAVVRLDEPTDYLQVRIRVRRPSGRLLYQKTLVDSNVAAGVRSFRFSRPLGDLELKPDAYPVELLVLADGRPIREWTLETDLRVYDPDAAPLPVALVLRVSSPPQTDPEGLFVTDPRIETKARDEVRALADAVLETPRLSASLAIAPVLLQEWRHIADGYELSSAGGIVAFGPDTPTAASYARTLEQLLNALATGRLELMDVPYADPDLSGLQNMKRTGDLAVQLANGAAAYKASLESTPSAGTYTARGALTPEFAESASKHGIRYAIVTAEYLGQGDATPTPGAYRTAQTSLALLVPDVQTAATATPNDAGTLLDNLFSNAIAKGRPAALPISVEVGPGRADSITAMLPVIGQTAAVPWLRFVTAGDAASASVSEPMNLATTLPTDKNAPPDYWPTVAEARRQAGAYSSAAPADDADAAAAVTESLIAECAWWAGPDGTWALADRARSFASAAVSRATAVFDKVAITGENITLSGTSGSVPFSVTNGAGKPLTVMVRATGTAVRVPFASRRTLAPGESYVTVPVDLRHTIEGRVVLEVTAGTVKIASQAISVRASYLDRLAILGAIVLVLVGMLVYISRRVRRAEDRHS